GSGSRVVESVPSQSDPGRLRARRNTLFARFHELPGRHAFDLGDEGRHDGVQEIPEINWTTRLLPALKRTRTFRAARALAAELLAGPAEHTGYDHAILKPPHNGRATPWHQDGAYAGPEGLTTMVHFWIPLHDVSLEMGCMQFIPGSHLGPILPHHPRAHRHSAHLLEVHTL